MNDNNITDKPFPLQPNSETKDRADKIRELSLKDKFLYNRITTEIICGAGHGGSKISTMLSYLLESYVDYTNQSTDLPEYCYQITREGLAYKLHISKGTLDNMLSKLQAHQDRHQIILLTWYVKTETNQEGKYRNQPTIFNLENFLDIWQRVEEMASHNDIFDIDPYRCVESAAREILGGENWMPTRPSKKLRTLNSTVTEIQKRIWTQAQKFGGDRGNVQRYLELVRKSLDELDEQARKLEGMEKPAPVNAKLD
jgi:hypothetical protein